MSAKGIMDWMDVAQSAIIGGLLVLLGLIFELYPPFVAVIGFVGFMILVLPVKFMLYVVQDEITDWMTQKGIHLTRRQRALLYGLWGILMGFIVYWNILFLVR